MRCKKKGFTLIELLVVIAIIAVLMGILMPALSRIRKQAKSVMCQTYLKQWGTIINMYCEDNDRKMPDRSADDDSHQGRWMYSMKYLYKDANDLKLCPLVKKTAYSIGVDGDWYGSTNTAWEIPDTDDGGGRVAGTYGSYGINGYCYDTKETLMDFATVSMHWKTPDVKGAADIPLFMDCLFWVGWPQAFNSPPDEPIIEPFLPEDEEGMQRFCLDRHNGRINACFFDFSVRPVGLKELWTLKWHKGYDRSGPYTLAGDAPADAWPDWMKQMKDY